MSHAPSPFEGLLWVAWALLLIVASVALRGAIAWVTFGVGMLIGVTACLLAVRRELAIMRRD